MDYFARDIVGISAYDFYHGNDVAVIQSHHAKCKDKFSRDKLLFKKLVTTKPSEAYPSRLH